MSTNVLELADDISRNERMTRDAIVKELMHHDLLRALLKTDLGKFVVFQGGTALRLCYGNQRYSEDLDFARHGTDRLDPAAVEQYERVLKSNLEAHYHDMHITITPPKEKCHRTDDKFVEVNTWVVKAEIDGLRSDEKRPKIKIEIADVPAHSADSRMLMNHYRDCSTFQPMLLPIRVQSRDEILADKVMAMMGRPRVQFRDVWDLHWLEAQRVTLKYGFIMRKFRDYYVSDSPEKIQAHFNQMEERIDFLQTEEGIKGFNREMARFLGGDLRLWLEPNHTQSLIKSVTDNLSDALAAIKRLPLEGPMPEKKATSLELTL